VLGSSVAVLVACAVGCATTKQRKADAVIEIVCAVNEARVYVDDTFVGRAVELRGRSVKVVHGRLRVEVRADGWFTSYREVPLVAGARERVEVPLRRVPEGEPGG
jgi:hypothetical protein